jgi:uncharacterized membrane protein
MLGIPGLDGVGLVHTLFGFAALFLGFFVLVSRKGTLVHRRLGQSYTFAMMALNVTALMIYDLYGRFGPFHVAAAVSMATVLAGLFPVVFRRPRETWMRLHATFMCWSYVGLFAAFVSEVATRVPGVRFGWTVVAATVAVVMVGAVLINGRVPSIVRTVQQGRPS